jgi:hypothetical protein
MMTSTEIKANKAQVRVETGSADRVWWMKLSVRAMIALNLGSSDFQLYVS